MLVVGIAVAAVKERPFRCADFGAGCSTEADPSLVQPTPFLPDFFSLVVIQRREEIGEIAVSGVLPVKLKAVAHQQACRRELRRVVCIREQDMQRREALLGHQRQRAFEQTLPCLFACGQQSRPGGRREGDRREQLWIVALPMAPVRVGPGPVEYVFSVRVRLQIQRHRADQRIALSQQQIARRPPGLRCGASGLVQRVQEGMRQQRLFANQRIPG